MERGKRVCRSSWRPERGTCTDILVRSFIFAWIAAAALLSPRFVEPGHPAPAAAQEIASQTAMPELPTPTPTDVVAIDPLPTNEPAETPTASDTVVPFDTPTPTAAVNTPATAVPTGTPLIPTETQTIAETATPTEIVSPTETPVTTETPVATPTVVLPALADVPDSPGTVTQAVIGADGGQVSTPDGRLVLAFGATTLNDDTTVTITQSAPSDFPTSLKNNILRSWNFSATDAAGPISTFAAPVVIAARLSDEDLDGLNPLSARLHTYDEARGEWTRVFGTVVDEASGVLTGTLSHFSGYGLGADPDFDTAAFSNIANLDLHSGAAQLSIPISLPASPGGLVPQLSLNYDSGRVNGMKRDLALGSWVGIGWQLTTGSISGTGDSSTLQMSGAGGPLKKRGDGVWRTQDHDFMRIERMKPDFTVDETFCSDMENHCIWRVTDKRGTQYFFGELFAGTTALDAARKAPAPTRNKYYQWDLSRVRDLNGQEILFKYAHVGSIDAYISEISWNDGKYTVEFDVGLDSDYYDPPIGPPVRRDTPYSLKFDDCPEYAYRAPKVRESRQLKELRVKIDGLTQKTYAFGYDVTNFTYRREGDCDSSNEKAGRLRLRSLAIKGRQSATLQTMGFDYSPGTGEDYARIRYMPDSAEGNYYWPLLLTWTNGLGGSVSFEYTSKNAYDDETWDPWEYCWSLPAVTKQTVSYGYGQPDVVTSYAYDDGPNRELYYWVGTGTLQLCNAHLSSYLFDYTVGKDEEFLGFGDVKVYESATAGDPNAVWSGHKFHTSRTAGDQARAGREYEAWTRQHGVDWAHESRSWAYTILGESNPDPNVPYTYARNVFLDRTDTYLKDGTPSTIDNPHTGVDYTYDAYGNAVLTRLEGDVGVTSDDVFVATPYHANTTEWVFVPKYERKTDRDPSDPAAIELGLKHFYYDGSNVSPASATAPSYGRLTAESTKLNTNLTDNFSTTYWVYDAYGSDKYGNVTKQSVPTFLKPEDHAAGPPQGSIPDQTIAYDETEYDTLLRSLPVKRWNALGQLTETAFDPVWQKPIRVADPTGYWVRRTYDEFGRTTKVWDQFDGSDLGTDNGNPAYEPSLPSVRFQYIWSGTERSILRQRRVTHGVAATRDDVRCLDAFGRAVETRSEYGATTYNSVRTDYDDRGRKLAESQPTAAGSSVLCPASPSPISAVNRTAYAYDPFGNIAVTTTLRPNGATGVRTLSEYNGLVSTSIDELGHVATSSRDLAAMTESVYEPGIGEASTIVRPSGQGFYAQWGATGTPHYQQIDDDPTPDDGATEITSQAWNAIDTHTYAIPTLPGGSVIDAIVVRFRWKHDDAITPDPTGPVMSAVFRQASIDTLGPSYHGTNGDGWRESVWAMPTNPRTHQPWSTADLAAPLEFGFSVYATAGARPHVTQAYVEVVSHTSTDPRTRSVHDRLSNLTGVIDAVGNTTTLGYDLAGRKSTMSDPDMGTWSYTYDAAGNLKTQLDARNITTTLFYDDLQRLIEKTYSNHEPDVNYEYDSYPVGSACQGPTAIGRQVRMLDAPGEETMCYDVRGRVASTNRTIDGVSYPMSYGYDALDQATQITYPDGDVVAYAETPQGTITGMSSDVDGAGSLASQSLLSNATFTPRGTVASLPLGNGQPTSLGYDYRSRLTTIQTGSADTRVMTYDDASNITSVAYGAETSTYLYDPINRLTDMSGPATAHYSYNSIGNLVTKQEGGSSITLSYPAAGAPRPHAAASTSGSLAQALYYDANGNLRSTGDENYDFDAENRLTTIVKSRAHASGVGLHCIDINGDNGALNVIDLQQLSPYVGTNKVPNNPNSNGKTWNAGFDVDGNKSVNIIDLQKTANAAGPVGSCMTSIYRYTYDGNGTLLKRGTFKGATDNAPALEKMVYIGGVYEKNTLTGGAVKKYYSAFGRTIAIRDVAGGSGQGSIYYPLADHLGSTVKVLDASGNAVSETAYWPYGATRSGSIAQTDQLFTGQRQEPVGSTLGLYNYKARFYSTTLGLFLSADTLTTDGLNRYAYVRGNPLRYSDPSGKLRRDEIEAAEQEWQEERWVRSGCDTACQWTSAWDAFHRAAAPIPLVTPGPTATEPIPVELPCGQESACGSGGVNVATMLPNAVYEYFTYDLTQGYSPVPITPFDAQVAVGGLWSSASAKSTTLFRAVSPDEAADIARFGFRQGPNSMEAKLFTRTASDAQAFGRELYGSKAYTIVRVQVGRAALRGSHSFTADGRPVVAVYAEMLHGFNAASRVSWLAFR